MSITPQLKQKVGDVHKNLYMNVHSSIICNSPKVETAGMSVTWWWMDNYMWSIHAMEYYSAIERGEIPIYSTT